jgi:putative colanic acid biosynthesis UDP-glucose lipid carrier transferase
VLQDTYMDRSTELYTESVACAQGQRMGGRIRPYSARLVESARALDAVLVIGSLWLLSRWAGHGWGLDTAMVGAVASLLFILIAGSNDLYRSWRVESLWDEVWRILVSAVVSAAGTVFVIFMLGLEASLPRALAIIWFVAAPTALIGSRVALRALLRIGRLRGHNFQRTAIVGSNATAIRIADEIGLAPWMGLKFVGYYDDRKPADDRIAEALANSIRGNVTELVQAALRGEVDRVYIALPLRAELRIRDLIERLAELPVTVHYVPDFFLFSMLRAQWEHVGETPVVNVVANPFLGVSGLTKRLEDIVLSSLILLIIALPLLVVAIAVRVSSAGPVIFRQRRYGLNGKEFEIWKFRTMSVMEDGHAFVQACAGDARMTRLGAFLRRTSLDELPQFINVLHGDMSIVGPRPHPVALDDEHRRLIPHYFFRHKIRPGITGLAQVNGFRGPTDTLEKMRGRIEYDIQYIEHWSLGLDLRIIAMTIVRGFVHKNAF